MGSELSQFSSVQSSSRVRLFMTPWTAAHQASLSIINSQSFPKLMSTELVMPSNHLNFCRPLLLLPSILPSIRVFSNESALRIRWPKYWSFSFNISPSNEYSALISFRICSFLKIFLFYLFFSHATWHAGSQFPNEGWDPHPLQWPCRVSNHQATREVAFLTCPCTDPVMSTFLTSLWLEASSGGLSSALRTWRCGFIAWAFTHLLPPDFACDPYDQLSPLQKMDCPLLSTKVWPILAHHHPSILMGIQTDYKSEGFLGCNKNSSESTLWFLAFWPFSRQPSPKRTRSSLWESSLGCHPLAQQTDDRQMFSSITP